MGEKCSSNSIIIFVAVLLLGFWYYQSQRPNYRDLEKAFNALNIPSDWELIGASTQKGLIGVLCIGQDIDITCPVLTKTIRISDGSVKDDLEFLNALIADSGFTVISQQIESCTNNSDPYYCIVFARKNDIKIRASISKNASLKELTISLE